MKSAYMVMRLVLPLSFWALVNPSMATERYNVKVPTPIQQDLFQRTERLVLAAHPTISINWLSGELAELFLQSELSIRVTPAPGCTFLFKTRGEMMNIAGKFPNGRLKIITREWLPGTSQNKHSAPISIDNARSTCTAILKRLIDREEDRKGLVLVRETGKMNHFGQTVESPEWTFVWQEKSKYAVYDPREVYLSIGKKDGRVVRLSYTPALKDYLGAPKITKEKVLKMADALPGRPATLTDGYLFLACKWWYAERRLVWECGHEPPPMGGAYDYAIWDAMTGEVLMSDCLKGGTRDKPYCNTNAYTEPGKEQLENSIKKWAREIKERNKARKAKRTKSGGEPPSDQTSMLAKPGQDDATNAINDPQLSPHVPQPDTDTLQEDAESGPSRLLLTVLGAACLVGVAAVFGVIRARRHK